jgi:hypothetical protein
LTVSEKKPKRQRRRTKEIFVKARGAGKAAEDLSPLKGATIVA